MIKLDDGYILSCAISAKSLNLVICGEVACDR